MTKIKVKIPQQSLIIEIEEQEIEIDVQFSPDPIPSPSPTKLPNPTPTKVPSPSSTPTPTPTKIPNPTPTPTPTATKIVVTSTPKPTSTPSASVLDLDEFLKGKVGVVELPVGVSVIKSKGLIKPEKVTALVGRNHILTFENWDVTPTQLFDLSGCKEFGIVGVTFVCPPDRPIVTGFPDKEVFGWNRDTVTFGKFAYINGQEIKDKGRVTFGLSRFAYSSSSLERIYMIGKNLWHNGFNFTQIKNPYQGNLWLILQNVYVHNPIIEQPQSHFYTPTRVKVRVKVENGIAKIISNNTFDQILTHWGYWENGVSSILHFDRYAYPIRKELLTDSKTLSLDTIHPLDNIQGQGTVLTKQINLKNLDGFEYTYDSITEKSPTSITLPKGEFDAFIVYKGNALFSAPVDKNTYFSPTDYWGSGVITLSQGYGWTWYNQEFSGYLDNFKGDGYFRNSTGTGTTQGLTIKESIFEKNPPVATANLPEMPKEAQDYITWLESL